MKWTVMMTQKAVKLVQEDIQHPVSCNTYRGRGFVQLHFSWKPKRLLTHWVQIVVPTTQDGQVVGDVELREANCCYQSSEAERTACYAAVKNVVDQLPAPGETSIVLAPEEWTRTLGNPKGKRVELHLCVNDGTFANPRFVNAFFYEGPKEREACYMAQAKRTDLDAITILAYEVFRFTQGTFPTHEQLEDTIGAIQHHFATNQHPEG